MGWNEVKSNEGRLLEWSEGNRMGWDRSGLNAVCSGLLGENVFFFAFFLVGRFSPRADG